MDLERIFERQINESIDVLEKTREKQVSVLIKICRQINETIRSGGRIYLFGNGGSAADSQHIATEFVCRFVRDRQPLPAIAFTSNMAVLTAVANDYHYSQVFARQVNALVQSGDICVGISTSGQSENVLEGLRCARKIGAHTIGFTGGLNGPIVNLCDICYQVPSQNSARVQEAHLLAWHIILDILEQDFIEHPK